MNISSVNSAAEARRAMGIQGGDAAAKDPAQAYEQRKKDASAAAKQFEAIMLRQLLAPAIEPMMNSGLGGEGGGGSGSGVYGYMLTDAMADSLSKGGGLGLSKLLEKQFTPKAPASAVQAASTYKIGKMNNHE